MKFTKSFLTGAGAFVLAGLTLALLAPQAAHAIAATLVLVTNTAASPAITESNTKMASQLVDLTLQGGNYQQQPGYYNAMFQISASGTAASFYVVPPGQNLVITEIDATAYNSGGVFFTVQAGGPGAQYSGSIELAHFYMTSQGSQQFRFSSGLVFPAGSSIIFTNQTTILGTGPADFVAHGYLTAN